MALGRITAALQLCFALCGIFPMQQIKQDEQEKKKKPGGAHSPTRLMLSYFPGEESAVSTQIPAYPMQKVRVSSEQAALCS